MRLVETGRLARSKGRGILHRGMDWARDDQKQVCSFVRWLNAFMGTDSEDLHSSTFDITGTMNLFGRLSKVTQAELGC
jgi:hypothetical protein